MTFLGSFLCIWLLWITWWGRRINDVSPTVGPAVEAVLKAHQWSRITGAYWENEMEDQAKRISTLSQSERLEFFRAMVLYCDLNDSRGTLFCELVAADAEALSQNLVAFKDKTAFQSLPSEQRTNVENWIREMRIVANQNRATGTRTNGE